MTVVVGVLCQDGVVIGSDSSATSVAGNIHTVEQPAKKVEKICDHIIFSGTGAFGLSQRFQNVVQSYFGNGHHNTKSRIAISQDLYQQTESDFSKTKILFNHNHFGAVLGFVLDNEFHLCEFPSSGFQPEFKTPSLWYVSMGSGQLIADPFLGFVRKIFWNNNQPSLKDGIFGTLWALEHSIEVNPGGIGPPAQIAIIQKNGNAFESKILSDDELQEHLDNLKGFENYIRDYKNQFNK